MSPDQLMDRVSELTDTDCRYALHWLATGGSDHPDGQALLHAFEALERHAGRLAEARHSAGSW